MESGCFWTEDDYVMMRRLVGSVYVCLPCEEAFELKVLFCLFTYTPYGSARLTTFDYHSQ